MFRGKISTSTGADVAHPGNRSQGILGAQQHLCAPRTKNPAPTFRWGKTGHPGWPHQPLVYYCRGGPGKKDKNVLEGFSNRDPRTRKPASQGDALWRMWIADAEIYTRFQNFHSCKIQLFVNPSCLISRFNNASIEDEQLFPCIPIIIICKRFT